MDPDSLANTKPNAPRKVRFAPKAPPKREIKPVLPKAEKVEDDVDAAKAQELLRRFNEASVKGKPKVERKAGPSQVAFGYGGSSASLRSYGASKSIHQAFSGSGSGQKVEKEYKEPWDYYTYYPVTLPMRRPYSGNPEHLDEEEFGESASLSYDENASSPALELGLMDENTEDRLFFLQLPATMPMPKQSVKAEGNEKASNKNPVKNAGGSQKSFKLEELPAGFMGKMLVYRSGAIKLKLGETLYNVSAGLDCVFAQNAVAINTEEKTCCILGELNKRAVITPDVESIVENMCEL